MPALDRPPRLGVAIVLFKPVRPKGPERSFELRDARARVRKAARAGLPVSRTG